MIKMSYWIKLKYFFIGFIFGFIPYIVTNQLSILSEPHYLNSEIDMLMPFIDWSIFIYLGVYVIVTVPVIMINREDLLKRVVIGFIILQAVAAFFFLAYPVHMLRPEYSSFSNFTDYTVYAIYNIDNPSNCFPSLHVGNSVYAAYTTYKVNRRMGFVTHIISFLICVTTLTTKQHYIADILMGWFLGYLIYYFALGSYKFSLKDRQRISNKDSHYLIFVSLYAMMVVGFFIGYLVQD
jgi:membrane-associated phospholipid phosphatase